MIPGSQILVAPLPPRLTYWGVFQAHKRPVSRKQAGTAPEKHLKLTSGFPTQAHKCAYAPDTHIPMHVNMHSHTQHKQGKSEQGGTSKTLLTVLSRGKWSR